MGVLPVVSWRLGHIIIWVDRGYMGMGMKSGRVGNMYGKLNIVLERGSAWGFGATRTKDHWHMHGGSARCHVVNATFSAVV